MSNVVSLDDYRFKKAEKRVEQGDDNLILIGRKRPPTQRCTHCNGDLYSALIYKDMIDCAVCKNCKTLYK